MAHPHQQGASPSLPAAPSVPQRPASLAHAALPSLPPLPTSTSSTSAPPPPASSSAISPSPSAQPIPSGSATPLPPIDASAGYRAQASVKTKADQPPEGEPKAKKKRAAKKPGEPGPGKSWRKGLKGNLAGVGLDPAIAASLHNAGSVTPSGSSPGPSRGAASVAGSSTTVAAVGAPPRLGNQYVVTHPLHIGTPRPRRWIKTKIAFKRVDGKSILLPSWQGDSYSPFADAAAESTRDELASPPPASSSVSTPFVPSAPLSKPRASSQVAGTHLTQPSSPAPPAPLQTGLAQAPTDGPNSAHSYGAASSPALSTPEVSVTHGRAMG